MKFKLSKQGVLVSVLVVLLVLALGYIAIGKWDEGVALREIEIYRAGLNDGYSEAVRGIIVSAEGCEIVSVYEGNKTVNLINQECLVIQ